MKFVVRWKTKNPHPKPHEPLWVRNKKSFAALEVAQAFVGVLRQHKDVRGICIHSPSLLDS